MMRAASLAVGTACLVISASAAMAQLADDTLACFGRAYTADHMAAHPDQSVVEMQIVMDAGFSGEPPDHVGPSMVETTVRATLRDRYGEFFANSGVCPWFADGSYYECQIDCDGGLFSIVLADDGTAVLANSDLGMILYGGCGQDVADDRWVHITLDGDPPEYQLYPMPIEACPVAIRTLYENPGDW